MNGHCQVRQIPFAEPSEHSTIPRPRELSADQEATYERVLQHFEELQGLENDDGELIPLNDTEKLWVSHECILRYLRASKWHLSHCISRIEKTLAWRRKFGVEPEVLDESIVSHENETGKEVILGYDNDSRPCLYLKPGRQNTAASHTQVQHLVFMLERVIEFMACEQDQLALLIDFQPYDVGAKQSKMPSMRTGREVLNILQDHYPERLGKALLTNMPRVARIFLKLIHPFIDPLTREKLVFDEIFSKYVPKEQLDSEFGGDVDFEYNHEVYWPAMLDLSSRRRAHMKKRHNELGGGVGLREADMREGFIP